MTSNTATRGTQVLRPFWRAPRTRFAAVALALVGILALLQATPAQAEAPPRGQEISAESEAESGAAIGDSPPAHEEAVSGQNAIEDEDEGDGLNPAVAELRLSASEASPGENVGIEGTCSFGGRATPDVHLSFDYSDNDFGREYWIPVPVTLSDTGSFSVQAQIPVDAYSGRYIVFLICSDSDAVYGLADQEFTVLGDNRPVKPPIPEEPKSTKLTEPQPTTSPPQVAAPAELARTGAKDDGGPSWLAALAAMVLGLTLITTRRRRRSGRAQHPVT